MTLRTRVMRAHAPLSRATNAPSRATATTSPSVNDSPSIVTAAGMEGMSGRRSATSRRELLPRLSRYATWQRAFVVVELDVGLRLERHEEVEREIPVG